MARGPFISFDAAQLFGGQARSSFGSTGLYSEANIGGSAQLGASYVLRGILEEFTLIRSTLLSPEAANVMVSITLELTVYRNVGTPDNPKRIDNIRFAAGAVQMVTYLEYVLARMAGKGATYDVANDDIKWIEEAFEFSDNRQLIYRPLPIPGDRRGILRQFSQNDQLMVIDAMHVVKWMPDFVKNIQCPCWPV